MADIFISYKSERKAAADHLRRIFELHGYSVWFDYALYSGRDYRRDIDRELQAANAVVVLWCEMSVQSDWVREEADFAKGNDKIVPVWLEKTGLPMGFRTLDTLDLSQWNGGPRDHQLDRLLEQVARLVGRDPNTEFRGLSDYEKTWRNFGAPGLAEFGLINIAEEAAGLKIASPLKLDSKPKSEPASQSVQHGVDAYGHEGYGKAFSILTPHATQGSSRAQFFLGRMCQKGNGTKRSDRSATYWYRKSADQGHAKAQFYLGRMYRVGRGVKRSDIEAVHWSRKAADQGHVMAQSFLGDMYQAGHGVTQSGTEAVRWYRKAAEQGDGNAIKFLKSVSGDTAQNTIALIYLVIGIVVVLAVWVIYNQLNDG
jgi:hypothetical protein